MVTRPDTIIYWPRSASTTHAPMSAGWEIKESGIVVFKMALAGNSGVGKTSLCNCICPPSSARYDPTDTRPTIGVDYAVAHKIVLPTNEVRPTAEYARGSEPHGSMKIALHVWDTAGCDRWTSVQDIAYRDAHIVLMVYSITQRESFEQVNQWLQRLDQVHSQFVPYVILVGNKLDLATQRQVYPGDVQQMCEFRGMQPHTYSHLETSAKDSAGIEDLVVRIFCELAGHRRQMLGKIVDNKSSPSVSAGVACVMLDPLTCDEKLRGSITKTGQRPAGCGGC